MHRTLQGKELSLASPSLAFPEAGDVWVGGRRGKRAEEFTTVEC